MDCIFSGQGGNEFSGQGGRELPQTTPEIINIDIIAFIIVYIF